MKKIIPIFCCIFLTLVLLGCPNEPVEPYIPEFSVYLAKTETDYTTIHVKQGDTVSKPEDPTRDYYNFLGWVTVTYDENGNAIESPYDFSTPVTTDLWIRAKWEPIQKNVVAASETVNFIENLAIVDEFCQDLHTLVVTGELTLENLDQILTAIYHTDLKINLDLTKTTGLTELKPVEGKDHLFEIMGISFWDKGIYKLSLPKTITKIDTGIFNIPNACKTLYFDGTLADYCAIDFVPCSEIYMGEERIWGHSPFEGFATDYVQIGTEVMKDGMNLIIPSSVTHIDDYAFYQLRPKSITLFGALESVGRDAFLAYSIDGNGYYTLKELRYGDSMDRYARIEYATMFSNPKFYTDTFYLGNTKISELETYTITPRADKIGSFAFINFDNFTTVDLRNVETVCENAFIDCNGIKNLVCNFSTNPIHIMFSNYNDDFHATFDEITAIGESIAEYCFDYVEIEKLILNTSTIPKNSIKYCTINNLSLGTSVKTIAEESIASSEIKTLDLTSKQAITFSKNLGSQNIIENLIIEYKDLQSICDPEQVQDSTLNSRGDYLKIFLQDYGEEIDWDSINNFNNYYNKFYLPTATHFKGTCGVEVYMDSEETWNACTFEDESSKPTVYIKNENGDYL